MTELNTTSQAIGALQASVENQSVEIHGLRQEIKEIHKGVSGVNGNMAEMQAGITAALAQDERLTELEKNQKKVWRYIHIALGFILAANIGLQIATAKNIPITPFHKEESTYERQKTR